MDSKRLAKLARGYGFLVRSLIGGKIVNAALDFLAFLDYRLLIFLSMWHPDLNKRIKYLRKRGVQVGEHVFIDQGVWMEITTPQSVIIEDYVGIGYGAIIVAHDATVSRLIDAPIRVKETRLRYGAGVGMNSIVLPGVEFGEFAQSLAGTLVTHDVPANMIISGKPGKVICGCEDVGLNWQADISVHPEDYFDAPNPWRPPSTPFDHLVTWRKDGIKVRQATELRTGTPFDYILDAKAEKEQEEK